MWHHVMNRGAAHRPIVDDDQDRQMFFDLLAECGSRFRVWTVCACLMDNHYHLLIHDEQGRLSRAMRHLNGVYTQRSNNRHGRDGSLFRGRYLSRVVEAETYLFEVARYIHANPVAAKLARRAGDYRWSSHRHYLAGETVPWLRKDLVLEMLGDEPERLAWFDDFVHERIAPEMQAALEPARWSPVLGSDSFVDGIRARLRREGGLASSSPQAARLAALTPEEVLSTARRVFGRSGEELTRGQRGTLNLPRLMTLLVCRDHTPARAAELAGLFGVRRPTVAVLAAKARKLARTDDDARGTYQSLMDGLDTPVWATN